MLPKKSPISSQTGNSQGLGNEIPEGVVQQAPGPQQSYICICIYGGLIVRPL